MNTNVVWSAMHNNRFLVEVTRIAPYRAELTVTDKGVILHQEETPLTFDATFGADSEDIRSWRQTIAEIFGGRVTCR
jgi:hypothetical protein